MGRLLRLFVVVPVVDLVLLIEIGRWIGTLPTLGLIVVTGALGAYLARRQGFGVVWRLRQQAAGLQERTASQPQAAHCATDGKGASISESESASNPEDVAQLVEAVTPWSTRLG